MYKKVLWLTFFVTALSAQITERKGLPVDISLITDFSYLYQTQSPDIRLASEVPGFAQGALAGPNSSDGFNLNYAELGISSSVDPFFDLYSVFHISQDGIEIEEAFFITKKLPFEIKAGRFLSSFGRLNSQHHHAWSFTTQPLVYKLMLGADNLLEKGVALNYTLPSDNYYAFGLEVFRGENGDAFGADPIQDLAKGVDIKAPNQPNLYLLYLKNSFEASDRLTILDNLSYAYGRSNLSQLSDQNITSSAFSGTTQMANIGLTLRYDFSAYSHLTFQNELLFRLQDGTEYLWDANASSLTLAAVSKEQSGFYSMLMYKADQNWGFGIRYDAVIRNSILQASTNVPLSAPIFQATAMIEYNPSEFSKLRLEYLYDNSHYLNNLPQNNQRLVLQFNHTIGTHKAHSF